MSTPVDRESAAAKRVAEELRSQGYSVELDTPLERVDESFGALRADIVARRGNEVLIVEVKSRKSAVGSNLAELAHLVEQLGENYRLDVEWIESSSETPPAYDVDNLAVRARALVEVDKGAALLLAWAALEGGMRDLAQREHIDTGESPASQVLADLYGNRIITRCLYDNLREIRQIRNSLAHGFDVDLLQSDSYLKYAVFLTSLTASLFSSPSFRAVGDAVEDLKRQLTDHDLEALAFDKKWAQDLVERVRRVLDYRYDPSSIQELALEAVRK